MILSADAPESIARAAQALKDGDLLGLPTETVYGLAADAGNDAAVAKIFAAKGRPADHPLIVHVAQVSDAADFASEIPVFAQALMQAFWPGPLTLIVPRRTGVAAAAAGGQNSVGLRCPAHPVAQAVLNAAQALGVNGVAAPSANQFGRVSPTTAAHVAGEFGPELLILDGGACDVGIESTIVDCAGDLQILRPGAVSRAEVEECLGRKVSRTTGPSRAPGMLASHYAPRATVRLVASADDADELESALRTSGHSVVVIGRNTDARSYAADLYVLLRRADDQNVDDIIAIEPPGDDLAAAVRDRLSRAATGTRS